MSIAERHREPRLEACIADLRSLLGEHAVDTGAERREAFSLDFSEQPGHVTFVIVRPVSAEQISDIVRLAIAHGCAINMRGGAMSYTRGHIPARPDTIMIDMTALDRVLEINTTDRYVVVETGVTWAKLREALKPTGMRVPYLGTLSGNVATIGGGLSQNATGMGRMTLAEHVNGLEVVLGDGSILKTGSWAGEGTLPFYRYFGPDTTGMFLCDSGAFGIKTKVALHLEPWPMAGFGCATFATRQDLVRAQVDMARSGLHTECFAFDGEFTSDYATRPAPPAAERRRMIADYLAMHPGRFRAYRNLLRAWHPKGLGFLKGLPNAMYYIAEGPDQASADASISRLNALVRRNGGKLLPTTIPFGLRYGPFLSIGDIVANRKGEVNFPINAKFPASKALEAMNAFEDFVAQNRPVLDEHGIRLACNSLLHGHFWGIEPVLFWKKPLSPFRATFAGAEQRTIWDRNAENAEATRVAIDFRYRLTAMFRELGSLHVQWAKAYPFSQALGNGESWNMIRKIKSITDPHGILSPGNLGLE